MEKEQVMQWVQNKIDKVLDKDIKLKILEENSSFDVDTYVNYLLDKYFNEHEIENLKKNLNIFSCYDISYSESENSSEQNSVQNFLEFESNEYQTYPVEEIIKNLENDSEEVKTKFLRVLELSVDLISQNFLNEIMKILQKNLNKTENRKVLGLVLKVFQTLLKWPKDPIIICKVFISIAEVVVQQINVFNLKVNNAFEKIYDIKEEKWVGEKKSSGFKDFKLKNSKRSNSANPEILIKLMRLLLDCQQQIWTNGMRLNETRCREIILSFIHLLSSTTTTSENTKLSGLELVSVLDPKASWCRYWCHTAVGRTLLCSALRKYKIFFIHIIEIMLQHMKPRKPNRLPSFAKDVSLRENSQKSAVDVIGAVRSLQKMNVEYSTGKEQVSSKKKLMEDNVNISSAPSELKENNLKKNEGPNKTKKKELEWIIKEIPRRIVNEAVFFHSVSLVSCLIQFRSGRALFPVQTATKKRLLNVQDLSFSIIEHLKNLENYAYENAEISFTSAYQAKVFEILNDLNKFKTHINSSRVSTERQLPYF